MPIISDLCEVLGGASTKEGGVSIFPIIVFALSSRNGWGEVKEFLICEKTTIYAFNKDYSFVSLPQTLGGFMEYIRLLGKTGVNVPQHLERMDIRVKYEL